MDYHLHAINKFSRRINVYEFLSFNNEKCPQTKKKLQLSLDQYVQVYQYNKVYRGLISKGILFQIDQTVLK